MLRAFFSSATGMRAQEILIDNTANNLANVNTNGFKRQEVGFADLHYANEQPAGAEVAAGRAKPIGTQIGSGVRVLGTTKVFSPGILQETGIPSDVAIEGNGFFKIILPGGEERFTRDGSFRIDGEGNFVTSDGFLLDGNITIPNGVSINDLRIGIDGTVSATEGNTSQVLGTIPVYKFINPMGLSNEGSNLLSETPASGAAEVGTPGSDVGNAPPVVYRTVQRGSRA